MEAMGIMGFTIGSAGMTFALITLGQVTKLKKELDELKSELNNAGVISSPETSDENN